MAESLRVGVQLSPYNVAINDLRHAWRTADEMGVDTIWTLDHFWGRHFEAWTLAAAMAVETRRAEVGVLVTGNSYRNPDLLADMARTADHLSGGRLILGVGAGWFQRDYVDYGYEYGTAESRLASLGESLVRIERRLRVLDPPPLRPIPILVAGRAPGLLRLVARHAHMWNAMGSVQQFRLASHSLDEACMACGRNPAEIERTALIRQNDLARAGAYKAAGAQHLIVSLSHPFDLSPMDQLLTW